MWLVAAKLAPSQPSPAPTAAKKRRATSGNRETACPLAQCWTVLVPCTSAFAASSRRGEAMYSTVHMRTRSKYSWHGQFSSFGLDVARIWSGNMQHEMQTLPSVLVVLPAVGRVSGRNIISTRDALYCTAVGPRAGGIHLPRNVKRNLSLPCVRNPFRSLTKLDTNLCLDRGWRGTCKERENWAC